MSNQRLIHSTRFTLWFTYKRTFSLFFLLESDCNNFMSEWARKEPMESLFKTQFWKGEFNIFDTFNSMVHLPKEHFYCPFAGFRMRYLHVRVSQKGTKKNLFLKTKFWKVEVNQFDTFNIVHLLKEHFYCSFAGIRLYLLHVRVSQKEQKKIYTCY